MSEENEAHSVDFSKWIEKGWWTSQEAFCVFMGHPPQNANEKYSSISVALFHPLREATRNTVNFIRKLSYKSL